MVDELVEMHGRLGATRRVDRVIGLLLTAGAVAVIIRAMSGWVLWICFVAVLATVAVYIPRRSRPRQRTLAEIRARLDILDPHCNSCGYSLRHLLQRRCPECGRFAMLPVREVVDRIVEGGAANIASGSVVSDVGWIVMLIMVLVASLLGKVVSLAAGTASLSVPPMVFLISLAIRRARHVRSLNADATCDACNQTTPMTGNQCMHCSSALLAQHVYVRPGLASKYDSRLCRPWAQLIGGTCTCATWLVMAQCVAEMDSPAYFSAEGWLFPGLQWLLVGTGLALLHADDKRRSKPRLRAFDATVHPLCHHCLGSLQDQPANGICPNCRRSYRAIQLAGGR